MVRVCADPGSTHLGRRDYAKELVKVAKECGADYVKFQLFGKDSAAAKAGNVPLHKDLFLELMAEGERLGIPVTASWFDRESFEFLFEKNLPFIKFAYSQRYCLPQVLSCLKRGHRVVLTTGQLDLNEVPDDPDLTCLFVDTADGKPQYPVPWATSFDGLFPPFDGYSDHHPGPGASIEAAAAGATWIEKHITLNYSDCATVPDGRFALKPKELERLCRELKK